MNQQYIKLAGLALGILLVLYVFFPTSARVGTDPSQPSQTTTASSHEDKSAKATDKSSQTSAAEVQAKSSKKASSKKSSAKTNSTAQKIEPEQTLRKAEVKTRSGPPSKMYGGL